jgi:hypothetical protein
VFCCEGCKQSFLLNKISNCDIGDIKLPEGIEPISKRELLRELAWLDYASATS